MIFFTFFSHILPSALSPHLPRNSFYLIFVFFFCQTSKAFACTIFTQTSHFSCTKFSAVSKSKECILLLSWPNA